MTALYAYIPSDFNAPDQIVLPGHPRPDGRLCTDLPFMPAPYLDLPDNLAAFEALYPQRFWKEIRRRYRMLERQKLAVEWVVVTDAPGMRQWLPRARRLFLQRWEKRYTSCRWVDDNGFAEHLRSAANLADVDKAQLTLLLVDGVVTAYALSLLDGRCCYIYHHAILMDERYKPYALAACCLTTSFASALRSTCNGLTLCRGGAHKSLWTSQQRVVRWRVTSPQTLGGYLLHGKSDLLLVQDTVAEPIGAEAEIAAPRCLVAGFYGLSAGVRLKTHSSILL
ncbi:MAG: GNAT family N-acetyltransferase [Candidatus Thiothrix singaporensis]|uniref:GNAT family N-acetyltransferase n=1 Tax=Candidatus Thiothrix singaporensis TaxID=2799669 RepID=A0A7L6APB9_9GAMM|nr:MAG: GNAT family N-acetyltransferase [Candidatus Thiothrix singaporensis]